MTQPPTGPPQGPPWGHHPPPGSQPNRGRGWEIFGGVVVGGIATVILPLMSLAVADQAGLGAIIVALLLVPALGLGLLFSKSARPWGLGLLIGWAAALIVVGGSCVAIIASLDGSL
jgi:hypothetical protein